jgi:dimethylaniline monooxygenase (N-oxide forming)
VKPALLERIGAGTVSPRPQIARIMGDCVVFADGSQARANTIIVATGYAVEFPFLDPEIVSAGREGLPLYRLVFPPDYPTLAFLGMFRVTGPVPPVAEMQARWVAQVLRGGVHLPAPDAMRAAIDARMALIARTGGNPFRLDFEAYLDLLAAEIGVLPRLWRHPRLWRALLTGPPVAARYRLDGRGRWCGAARVTLAANRPKPIR